MLNLDGQLDGVQNHHGYTSVGISVRELLDSLRLIEVRKPTLYVSWGPRIS